MKWIQIFKTGTHTASDGTEREFTETDLQSTINNFKAPIPVLIGHEKPSYEVAKITQLMKKGNILMGLLSEENIDRFSTIVRQGLNRVSSGFSDIGNMVLDHVALLGTTPMPAIKDLKPIQFQTDSKIINIDFLLSEGEFMDGIALDAALEKQGNVFVEKIKTLFSKAAPPNEPEKINTSEIQKIIKTETDKIELKFQEELAAVKKENTELKNSLGNSFSESRSEKFSGFLDSDEMKKKITPGIKAQAMRIFSTLDKEGEFEYSEGDKKIKTNPIQEFKELLKNIPEQIEFNEFAVNGVVNNPSDFTEVNKMIEDYNKKGTV
jgi:hypothetical protein